MDSVDLRVLRKPLLREIGFKTLGFLRSNDFPGAWRLSQFITKVLMWQPSGIIQCSTIYGFDIVINPAADRGVELSIFMTGTYEHGTLEVIRSVLKAGDVFLDIGANVGLMSLFSAQCVGASGQVHSFEPVPEIFAMLSASAHINGFNNMFPHCLALGTKDEQKLIFEHPEVNRGSSSLMDWGDNAHGVSVAVSTLDSFTSRNLPSQRIAMAKIDVEGWELEVLKGGTALLGGPFAPALCVEYSTVHPMYGGAHIDLYDLVVSLGYKVFKLQHGKSTKSGLISIKSSADLPVHDNIFCFKDDHLRRLDKVVFA